MVSGKRAKERRKAASAKGTTGGDSGHPPGFRSVLMFTDPHPEGRLNTRFFRALLELTMETTVQEKEAQRRILDSLLLVTNKLATAYRHLEKYKRIEVARLQTARKNPLRKVEPVGHDVDLYAACDDCLIQLRDNLNHIVHFPRHFIETWPLARMPETVDACLSSLDEAIDVEKDARALQSLRAARGMIQNNREWIQGLVSLVGDGLHAGLFKVFVSAVGEGEPVEHVPMWTGTETIASVIGSLWDNCLVFGEFLLGIGPAARLAPGRKLGFQLKDLRSPDSPWTLVKPEPRLEPRVGDLSAVREALTLRQSGQPMIDAVYQGKRFRAVGNTVVFRPPSETFHEFLWGLLRQTLGEDWWTTERDRPEGERHQIMRWFDSLSRWKQEVGRDENRIEGGWGGRPSGDVQALTSLAYDVYTLRYGVRFPDRLLARLKDRSEFQGAKYEMAVAAILSRASFKLDYLEGSGKHCEFIASHPSGVRIGIEAKSRRRPGVLHEKGPLDELSAVRGDVQSLFDDAKQQKPAGLPFLIFIDLNAPLGSTATPMDAPWFEDLHACLDTHEATRGERPDPFNALVVTNFSTHYVGAQLIESKGTALLVHAKRPADPLPEEILLEIWSAVGRYGSPPEDLERFEAKGPDEDKGA